METQRRLCDAMKKTKAPPPPPLGFRVRPRIRAPFFGRDPTSARLCSKIIFRRHVCPVVHRFVARLPTAQAAF